MTDQARLPSMGELNQLPAAEFAAALRPLFEATGPLAEPLSAGRPYASYDELLDRAAAIAAQLSVAEQIEVVNAHPRIGENPARVSSWSYREQGYDYDATLPSAEVARVATALTELNRAYEAKFGFRFVVFVNKRPKSEIIDVLRERLSNSRTTELETALRDLFSIARDRRQQLA